MTAFNNERTRELFDLLMERGYPEVFCRQVCGYLNTEYTAMRMIGYLQHYSEGLSMEVIADELITILSDRERFIRKAESEKAQASYTAFLNRDRSEEEDDFEEEEQDHGIQFT